MKDFFYKVNDKEYLVKINYKKIKNIHYRFKDDHFEISCPSFVLKSQIVKGLDKFADRLIKTSKSSAQDDTHIYLYGVDIPLNPNGGEIRFTDGSLITYTSIEELNKKLRKQFLENVTYLVFYYSKVMNVELYKVKVKDMKTRFGSNSRKTKTLHFSTYLLHFSQDIISSVVVHELAHILVYNHSHKFYDVVYKYCPNYDICRKKLIKGVYL